MQTQKENSNLFIMKLLKNQKMSINILPNTELLKQ